jgi:hypothetical protein
MNISTLARWVEISAHTLEGLPKTLTLPEDSYNQLYGEWMDEVMFPSPRTQHAYGEHWFSICTPYGIVTIIKETRDEQN